MDAQREAWLIECLPRLEKVARSHCGDPETAEELVGQTVLEACVSANGFRGNRRKFWSWLRHILLNNLKDYRRQQATRPTLLSLDEPSPEDPTLSLQETLVDESALSPDQAAEQKEFRRWVRREIAGLPPHYRELLTLFYLDDLKGEEIAARLDTAVGTIRVQLHRARAALRTRLEQHRADWEEFIP